jgi:small subunit ribosomal protein S13
MPEFKHIVRVVNTDLDGNKKILHALHRIKGVSFMMANAAIHLAGIEPTKRAGDLMDAEIAKLDAVLKDPLRAGAPLWMINRRNDPESGKNMHLLGSDWDFAVDYDIKLMKKCKSYKGLRHQWGQPVRGQRTKSNFRRNKGKGLGVTRKAQAAQKGAGDKDKGKK